MEARDSSRKLVSNYQPAPKKAESKTQTFVVEGFVISYNFVLHHQNKFATE
jgi:hypothetical protein